MSCLPDNKPPSKPTSSKRSAGVWRFALEGAQDDWAVSASDARPLDTMHSEADRITLCLDADGVLTCAPCGSLMSLGISVDALPGTPISRVFGASFSDALLRRVKACIELQVELCGALEVSVAGASRRFRLNLVPGHPGDLPNGCTAVLRDVTRAVGPSLMDGWDWQSSVALASGIAHRFNNLLVAITGNAGLIKASLAPDHPEHAALAEMEQAAGDMAAMTRALLAFAGEGRYAIRPVSIREVACRAVAALGPARHPNVRLVERHQPELPAIQGDPYQLEQAIFNLLINAVEAVSSTGGTVQVTTELLDDSTIRVTVKDDGPGIEEAVRSRIFEPFYTTKAPGRGLGLPTVLGIARGHSGSIRVRTSEQGTEVQLYLPCSDRPPRAGAPPTRRAGSRNLVLVVDDDRGTVRVLQRALRMLGYQVVCAGTGEEALRIAEQRKADIVLAIVDLALPDTSGDLLCGQLKGLMPATAVLVCSGYADARSAEQMTGAGADGFVGKPFSTEELAAAIRKATGG